MNEKHTKDIEINISQNEIAYRQILLKRQERYYNEIISDYKKQLASAKKENDILNGRIKEITNELAECKAKLAVTTNTLKHSEAKRNRISNDKSKKQTQLSNYYSGRIINCSDGTSIHNLGFSKNKDKEKKLGRELKLTFLSSVPCRSMQHNENNTNALLILETYRRKDNLCLSLCRGCLNEFVNGIESVDSDNTLYINEVMDFEIRYTNKALGPCISCYSTDKPNCNIRIVNAAFNLCRECALCWSVQLKNALRER